MKRILSSPLTGFALAPLLGWVAIERVPYQDLGPPLAVPLLAWVSVAFLVGLLLGLLQPRYWYLLALGAVSVVFVRGIVWLVGHKSNLWPVGVSAYLVWFAIALLGSLAGRNLRLQKAQKAKP